MSRCPRCSREPLWGRPASPGRTRHPRSPWGLRAQPGQASRSRTASVLARAQPRRRGTPARGRGGNRPYGASKGETSSSSPYDAMNASSYGGMRPPTPSCRHRYPDGEHGGPTRLVDRGGCDGLCGGSRACGPIRRGSGNRGRSRGRSRGGDRLGLRLGRGGRGRHRGRRRLSLGRRSRGRGAVLPFHHVLDGALAEHLADDGHDELRRVRTGDHLEGERRALGEPDRERLAIVAQCTRALQQTAARWLGGRTIFLTVSAQRRCSSPESETAGVAAQEAISGDELAGTCTAAADADAAERGAGEAGSGTAGAGRAAGRGVGAAGRDAGAAGRAT